MSPGFFVGIGDVCEGGRGEGAGEERRGGARSGCQSGQKEGRVLVLCEGEGLEERGRKGKD